MKIFDKVQKALKFEGEKLPPIQSTKMKKQSISPC